MATQMITMMSMTTMKNITTTTTIESVTKFLMMTMLQKKCGHVPDVTMGHPASGLSFAGQMPDL